MLRVRGWFLVYVIVLAVLAAHGLELTIASLIIGADPSLAGLATFVPAYALTFYVISNLLLILYTVLLFMLITKRKRSAIVHSVIFNILSIVFLVTWHAFHMKSTVGVVIDTAPNIVLIAYILTSKRVRQTLRR
ncbi:hypothetical protein ACQPZX_29090 [Actinoplanes sp. CA-142083]|uniref:hypothetical protein n=1 Tax=Actinoplanes sp. CA-142083 TaxID=3239903 RepID=UPI003D90496F